MEKRKAEESKPAKASQSAKKLKMWYVDQTYALGDGACVMSCARPRRTSQSELVAGLFFVGSLVVEAYFATQTSVQVTDLHCNALTLLRDEDDVDSEESDDDSGEGKGKAAASTDSDR